ncbi:MAG: hypothetical protein SVR04_02630 [Spirochaetota bacterium]|nr:hypothetical protein [Spirochaetota bacterium]
MYSAAFFRRAILILLVGSLSLPLFSQSAQQSGSVPRFDDFVAFEYTIDDLAANVAAGEVADIPKDRYMVLDGIVSSRQLISPQENDYFGILELSSGDWKNGEELFMYRCYVQLIGPGFAGTIPEPRSRTSSPNEIPLHSHILLIGRYLGYGEDQQGNRFPVLEAVDFRILQQ